MASLNKYYNFLKENNITDIELLKQFISGDSYKLKFKEDNNLILIFNDNNSNLNDDLVKFFNGVIIEKSSLKVVCFTLEKCMEEDKVDDRLFNKDLIIQPVFEGTLIRLYYYNNKWNVSTKKMIDAFNAKKVEEGFSYNSGNNDNWETIDSIRSLVKKYIDPNFTE